jgi:hypothetical protein
MNKLNCSLYKAWHIELMKHIIIIIIIIIMFLQGKRVIIIRSRPDSRLKKIQIEENPKAVLFVTLSSKLKQ